MKPFLNTGALNLEDLQAAVGSLSFFESTATEMAETIEPPTNLLQSSAALTTLSSTPGVDHAISTENITRAAPPNIQQPHQQQECGGSNFAHIATVNKNKLYKKTEKGFECRISGCRTVCVSKFYLDVHQRNTHGDPATCIHCGFMLKNQKALDMHSKHFHHGERLSCFADPACAFKANSVDRHIKHQEMKHSDDYFESVQFHQILSKCAQLRKLEEEQFQANLSKVEAPALKAKVQKPKLTFEALKPEAHSDDNNISSIQETLNSPHPETSTASDQSPALPVIINTSSLPHQAADQGFIQPESSTDMLDDNHSEEVLSVPHASDQDRDFSDVTTTSESTSNVPSLVLVTSAKDRPLTHSPETNMHRSKENETAISSPPSSPNDDLNDLITIASTSDSLNISHPADAPRVQAETEEGKESETPGPSATAHFNESAPNTPTSVPMTFPVEIIPTPTLPLLSSTVVLPSTTESDYHPIVSINTADPKTGITIKVQLPSTSTAPAPYSCQSTQTNESCAVHYKNTVSASRSSMDTSISPELQEIINNANKYLGEAKTFNIKLLDIPTPGQETMRKPTVLLEFSEFGLMQHFPTFIKFMYDTGLYKLGAVLVRPPPSFRASASNIPEDMDLGTLRESKISKQSECGNTFIAYFDSTKNLTSSMKKYFANQNSEPNSGPIQDLENEAFAEVLGSKSQNFQYAAGISGTMFRDDIPFWHLNRLDNDLNQPGNYWDYHYTKSGNRRFDLEARGLNRSELYIGRKGTLFPIHIEDGNFGSIFYLHQGQNGKKWWNVVGPENALRVQAALRETYPDKFAECKAFSRHKNIYVKSTFFEEHKIPYTRIVQPPGTFVVLWSNAYHCGFNSGNNIGEAVNWVTGEVYQHVKLNYPSCECKDVFIFLPRDGLIKRYEPEIYDEYMTGKYMAGLETPKGLEIIHLRNDKAVHLEWFRRICEEEDSKQLAQMAPTEEDDDEWDKAMYNIVYEQLASRKPLSKKKSRSQRPSPAPIMSRRTQRKRKLQCKDVSPSDGNIGKRNKMD